MNWEKVQLGSLCTVVRGSSPRPKGDPRYYGGTIPRLMVSDVSRDGMYVTPSIDYLTDEGAKKSRPMKSGSVIIAVSGNPGEPTILMIDACIHDGFVGLRNLDVSKVHKPFLYSFLKYYKEKIKLGAVGAIYKNLTTAQIKSIEFPLFPLPIQKKIAAVLDKVDVLRQKDQALLDAYDQLRQSFFWEMFGDVYKKTKQWPSVKIKEVVTRLTNGYVGPTRGIYQETGIPYLLAKHVKSGIVKHCGKVFIEKKFNDKNKKSILKTNDILLVQSGVNTGESGIVHHINEGHNCHALIVITTKNEMLNPIFFNQLLNSIGGRALTERVKTGATIAHLNCKKVKEIQIPLPPLDLQNKFATIIQNIEAQKAIVKQQQVQSEALFQSLLQKAFKGELFGEGLEKTE